MKRNITILCAAVFAASTFVGLASTATAAPVPPIVNTSPPQIFGTPKVGETLIASRGGWRGTYGSTPSTRVQFSYQWFYGSDLVSGANSQSFTIEPSIFYVGLPDRGPGGRFRVLVTAKRISGDETQAYSAETARLPRGTVTAGTTVLSGRNQVGHTLSVAHNNWSPEPLGTAIAWFVGDEWVSGCMWAPIPADQIYAPSVLYGEICAPGYEGAFGPSQYSPKSADVGKRIVAVVGKSRPGFFVTTRRAYAGYTRAGQFS